MREESGVERRSTLAELFCSPPAIYRPTPQWSWNGDLEEARIVEQLAQFAAQGCGGLFAHARPGHITGYLSERWLDLWGFALEEAARLGIGFHIYDEFMCPAGHAGGLVVSEHPHLAQQELLPFAHTGHVRRLPGEALAFFRVRPGEAVPVPVNAQAVQEATPEHPVLVLTLVTGTAGRGGLPMPDLSRRETTDAFIEVTHSRYAQRFANHFGPDGDVRFMFSDEPHITGIGGGLPMSRYLLKEFWHDHRYDLEGCLGELCFAQEGSCEVRYDYWSTVNRLFNENFMGPMHDWCERHGLLFTGHLMEHEWPSPRSHPDAMASLRWMHAPGNDLLGFQFEPTTPGDNGIYLLNLKELDSVKQQLGRDWMLVETCGGGGYDKAFETFKPLEDLVLAFGFNVVDPHLSHESLAGLRKYDWPQTLSDHSPWWAYYRSHADHVARANAALCQGQERNRVLVLHPTTSAWLHYAAPAFESVGAGGGEKMAQIQQSQVNLLLQLYGSQVDFDLGDEFILEELGRAEEGRLVVGERAYEAIVLPPAMENWTTATLALVRAYLEQGGQVYALRSAPERVDGRRSSEPSSLQRRWAGQWRSFESADGLLAALRHAIPPRVATPAGGPLPGSLCWRRVELGGGEVLYFFCNPWAEALQTDIRLEGPSVVDLDTATGKLGAYPARADGDTAIVHLNLPPRGHALWLCRPASAPAQVRDHRPTPTETHIPLELDGIERLAPNLLMLDYCDLEADGRTLTGVNTIHAGSANWRWQGFDRNPWRRQFKRTVIDRPLDPHTGFVVRYRFTLSDDLPHSSLDALCVGIERPWLYRVRLNGQPLAVEGAARWFDEHARIVPIGGHTRPGENVLELEARPFHVLCEIMPVYLVGDFALESAERGFCVAPSRALNLGDWVGQGLFFYPDAVRYRFSFHLVEAQDRLAVSAARWKGAVVAVELDSREIGVINHPPYRLPIGFASAGAHDLSLDVLGNVKNMMGPHHAEGLPGSWTWEKSPASQPPGSEYRFESCGLLEVPELLVPSYPTVT